MGSMENSLTKRECVAHHLFLLFFCKLVVNPEITTNGLSAYFSHRFTAHLIA